MGRDAWIIAALMVDKHGFDAADALADRLAALDREDAEDERLLLWCQVGEAVLEIVRPEPAPSEAVH
ncbi:MAG TPA: hypothetical protein VLX85_14095 [Stellaceae bacterium]|nr:hypothetical protein [Stellaceae bacterium]